ncbi:hypothetical protein [Actinokineospora spheciospongiae]|uniref:hypothetical protein n=1 Tax=Actinokineospora spheciospongiae TaxID=909613 RepID=UPI000D71586D|nr:hypothetical protein [Actinokineospora spheciospongiae]PWW53668.1 hypothetical protein DFQ13_11551 [Actinokineospora spheciospongiae]
MTRHDGSQAAAVPVAELLRRVAEQGYALRLNWRDKDYGLDGLILDAKRDDCPTGFFPRLRDDRTVVDEQPHNGTCSQVPSERTQPTSEHELADEAPEGRELLPKRRPGLTVIPPRVGPSEYMEDVGFMGQVLDGLRKWA